MKRTVLLFSLLLCIFIAALSVSAAEEAILNGNCGTDATWSLDTASGTLTISGTGRISSFPWKASASTIQKIIVGDGITSIDDGAFKGCTALEEITLPFVGKSADATVDYETPFGWIFGHSTSSSSGGIHQVNGYHYYSIPSSIKKVVITSDDSLPRQAFENCASIEEIVLPDSLSVLGYRAFGFCDKLKKVTLPSSLTSIPASAFAFCSALTDIVIPESVTVIGGGAFEGCSSLTAVQIESTDAWMHITFKNEFSNPLSQAKHLYLHNNLVTEIAIPDSVTEVSSYALYNARDIQKISIPDSVTSIGKNAFYNCASLRAVTVPDSVTSIDDGAFKGCTALEEITLPFVGKSADATVDYETPFGWIFGHSTSSSSGGIHQVNGYHYYSIPSSIKKVVITSDDSLPRQAFENCASIEEIVLPDSLSVLGYRAFGFCDKLKKVTLPSSLTSIPASAFAFCSALTDIVIPESVTVIGGGAFEGCSSLTSVQIENIDCNIYDSKTTIPTRTKICGHPGSPAELYAAKYNRTFATLFNPLTPLGIYTNGSGTLRFVTKVTKAIESPDVEYFGTFIVPLSYFNDHELSVSGKSQAGVRYVRYDQTVATGTSYAADLCDIPSDKYDVLVFAWSYIKFKDIDTIYVQPFDTITVNSATLIQGGF